MNEQLDNSQIPENIPVHHNVVNITPDHENFTRVNSFLSEYFLGKGEYESEEIIKARFNQPFNPNNIHAKFFMKAIFDNDTLIGARAHQIVIPQDDAPEAVPVIVFLMNILVDKNNKNKGAGAALRQAAQDDVIDMTNNTVHQKRPVLYVAEMEPFDPNDPESLSRYKAYIKSGFRLINPNQLRYKQLDDPTKNSGEKMDLMVAKELNHHEWDEETSVPKIHIEQVIAALKYSYTAVGYAYNSETEPKIITDSPSYETQAIPSI